MIIKHLQLRDKYDNNVRLTSSLCGNNQRFQLFTPAHGRASDESEHVCLLSGKPRDGELPTVGAHLHRGPALRVPAVYTVGDLVSCSGTEVKTGGKRL